MSKTGTETLNSIYLDNSATTFPAPEVVEAMAEYQRQGHGNPSSQHELGRRARKVLEDCRDELRQYLGADAKDHVIFTSGGTEANNLAILGLSRPGGEVLVSPIEHPSVIRAAEVIERTGGSQRPLAVNPQGQVQLDDFESALHSGTSLVSVMYGNHETGVLQPVELIARRCATVGVPMHTDAAQAVGKVPICFRDLGVSAMSLGAHKFHGPVGIGALIVSSQWQPRPILWGGPQQEGFRAGTEPVPLVVGMVTALRLWYSRRHAYLEKLTNLRQRLEEHLTAKSPDITVIGKSAERLPHITNIVFPGADRQAMLMALDLEGIACSAGSACASGSPESSPVLAAMGVPTELISGALRFSVSILNRVEEIDTAARRILHVYRRLRGQRNR